MIILGNLSWGNWFSYGPDNTLDLAANSLSQILGANGFGKSSIPLILEETLFNKNSKGVTKAEIPNRDGDGTYWSKLSFSVGADEYLIDLHRKSSMKVKLYKNGIDISAHTATGTFKEIQEILGMDFNSFDQLVYQNPKTSLQFLSSTDSARKKFFIELFDLSQYAEAAEKLKSVAKEHENHSAKLKGELASVERWLASNSNIPEELEVLEEVALDIQEELSEIEKLESYLQSIDQHSKVIEANEKLKRKLASLDNTPPESTKDLGDRQVTLGSLKANIESFQVSIRKIGKLNSTCPTCSHPIDISKETQLLEDYRSNISALKPTVEALELEIQEILAHNKKVAVREAGLKEWNSVNSRIDWNLESEVAPRADIEKTISSLRASVNSKKAEVSRIRAHNDLAIKTNARRDTLLEQQAHHQEQLALLTPQIEEAQELTASIEVLRKALGPNGLVAYKIEGLVKDLEMLTNEYLVELSDGRFSIAFGLEKDKLNVNLTDNGKAISINAPSSGERARIDTAALLAVRKLLAGVAKNQLNVLFLDEVIGVLDTEGREKLVEILHKETTMNTFIVSHEWQHPLLAKIEITREEDGSKCEG